MTNESVLQASPKADAQRITLGSVIIAFETFLFLGFAWLILIRFVPVFIEMFRQSKLPIPGSTLLLRMCSDAVRRHPWVPMAMVTGFPFLLLRLSNRWKKVCAFVVPLTTLLFAGWVVDGLFFWCWMCHLSIGPPKH